MMIKKCEVRKAVLFTAGCGAIPVHSLHLYCEHCKVNYHHNYRVGEHQFAERKLINLWISMMLLSWTSATNCARIFNTAMTEDSTPDWQFSLSLTPDQVYDGFTILSLLEDCITQQKTLVVPHGEVFHHRKKCTRTYENPSRKTSVIVIDGVSVAHTCCGVPNCKIPLENNRHRFCPEHSCMNSVCSIVNCSNLVIPGRKSCALVDHQRVEDVHNERGQEGPVPVTPNSTTRNSNPRIRAQFGRRRTHNEQLFIAPCGIIIARETFYHAEALYSVIVSTMPDHIFFDNNCSIAKIVKNDPVFKNVGLTVDVFHFNCKHSDKDLFCQEHCNPVAYPELLGENGKAWYFNSSIAEQTNAWLGGYQSMCREMTAHRFNFFLDEMIWRRNIITKKKLEKEGCKPKTWPIPGQESLLSTY
ncbi:hypothetical protein BYT27DRAFT_7226251 [Phlegmacium glaucopus]|nr:hypothetical protein BYT27DRAFT_7226251 [Phlegmacium glaucopus]